jgi:thiamine biosynthesis lipoprotein
LAIGIQNVLGVKEFVHIFDTSNETITTSATIVNSDNNEIRRLIISPETGMPVEGERTVSVKSESATLGEFLSISWLILPENDRIIMSEKFRDVEILEVNYINPSDYKTKLTIL